METVADDIIRLGSELHNFYLLVEGGKATAIDVGCSGELGALEKGLASRGLGLDDLEAVLVTHGHADHAGAARAAADKGVDVRSHVDEVPRLTGNYEGKAAIGPLDLPLHKPVVWKFLLTLVGRGVLRQPKLVEVGTFADGEQLDLPGKPLVVHTPGHTEGHCAFHVPASGALLSGDSMVTIGLIGPAPGPQLMPEKFHNDVAVARESLSRMESLDASVVLPGHGAPFQGSPAEMVAAVRARMGR